MADARTPRENNSRDKETRYEYQPAAMLPEPKENPDFAYRYVATHVMGVLDPTNAFGLVLSNAMRLTVGP